MTSLSLSQSIKKDSITIYKETFKSIIKESKKCDSVRVALVKKDSLVLELIENNLQMFSEFSAERLLKNEAIKQREDARLELDKFDRKRFGVGFSVGASLGPDFTVQPAIMIGINYSIFRF